MNRPAALIACVLFGVASMALAQATPEPLSMPKIMRARAGWMKAMTKNLAAKRFAEVARDAGELSAQAGMVAAEAAGEPKALHQKLSDLAAALALAAGNQDEAGAGGKLAEIKNNCTECHSKYR